MIKCQHFHRSISQPSESSFQLSTAAAQRGHWKSNTVTHVRLAATTTRHEVNCNNLASSETNTGSKGIPNAQISCAPIAISLFRNPPNEAFKECCVRVRVTSQLVWCSKARSKQSNGKPFQYQCEGLGSCLLSSSVHDGSAAWSAIQPPGSDFRLQRHIFKQDCRKSKAITCRAAFL